MPVCAAPPFAVELASTHDTRNAMPWRPHDLLRLHRLQALDDEPPWVREAFERAPVAVVRRAPAADGFIAIGLRGVGRAQRYGTWARIADIESVLPPEVLAQSRPLAGRGTLAAFAALAALQDDASRSPLHEFVWGPTGSVGFELATQVPTVSASSDLDLLIRTPTPLTKDHALALLNHLQAVAQHAGIRVDVQLDTPSGGVALAEWAAHKPRVMARHASGPHLIADPWTAAHDRDYA